MKITKRQLRRIIKEEKQKLLRENQSDPHGYGGFQSAIFSTDVSTVDPEEEWQDADDMEQQFIAHVQKFQYVPSAYQPGDHVIEYGVETWLDRTD